MAQLDYMEKRGSGLTRICNETKALEGYKDELKPVFKSTPTQFQTIIYANVDEEDGGKDGGKDGGDVPLFELTKIQDDIIGLIQEDNSISVDQMAVKLAVKKRTLEREIANMKQKGYISRTGSPRSGHWEVNIPHNCIVEIV